MDAPNDVLRFADVVLDEARREVFRGGTRIELTATEFNLLRYFLLNPRRVLSKRQILEHVWRSEFGTGNVVETYVRELPPQEARRCRPADDQDGAPGGLQARVAVRRFTRPERDSQLRPRFASSSGAFIGETRTEEST